jgi:hypothetical protein
MGCYLFGVAGSRVDLGQDGTVAGRPARSVEAGGLTAIVADLPHGDFKPRPEDLLAHASLLESIAATVDVLPMRFGVILPSEDAVRRFLERSSGPLLGSLEELAGLVEVQVKIDYEPERVLREIAEGDARIARLNRKTQAGGTYRDKVRLGELVADALHRRRHEHAGRVVSRLGEFAVRSEPGPVTGEYTMLNHSFLVPRRALEAFDAALGAVDGEGIRIRAVGPMPPYSFVDARTLAVA